jgi:dTDP-4-amino-4,6-dideoxygalactose transaminase
MQPAMIKTKNLKIEKHTSDGSGQLDCLPFSSTQDQPMNVPLLDLKAHHAPIKDEVLSKISEVIDCNAFAGGPFVESFEYAFADYCKVEHAIGVGSGTESLWLALLAQGIGPGDEVITAPNTFIATAEAINFTGARPVFVDILADTYNLNPELIEEAITPKTKAIIPVHLFGQMADMDPILEIAERHGLFVMEDSAQAVSADYKGRRAGSIGHCASFSFYPGKNLGAFGDAGAITTNDASLAQKIRILRDHGQAKKYFHSRLGWNSRMDGIQGAVLELKLKGIDLATARRREAASRYSEKLSAVEGIFLPSENRSCKHVYHIYSIRVNNRDTLLESLLKRGVGGSIHYPIPVHLQEACQSLGYEKGDFPIAEKCASEFLSLPMFPEITEEQISYVANTLKELIR